ncbi:DUF3592 domain-containing protein [Streptomyces decoyicus]|uniref:DUF3592 domain-containing protein n=1 Tax=Streptomyces decoyicus TaxID=249567 RepID=UPI0033B622D9
MGLPVLFIIIGFVGFGYAIREFALQRRLRREGVRAEGVVVRHRSSRSNEGTVYFAVVNFVDAQGSPHEFEGKASGVKGLPLGGQAPVLYLPSAPQTARIDLSSMRGTTLGLPLVAGAGFMVCAIAMLIGH